MKHFWIGFEKRAQLAYGAYESGEHPSGPQKIVTVNSDGSLFNLGDDQIAKQEYASKEAMDATKGIRSGLHIGSHPRPNVAVASAFKPKQLPTPELHNPASNLLPHLSGKKSSKPKLTKQHGSGVGEMAI